MEPTTLNYDYEVGSARLLGRDISNIAFASTAEKLVEILKGESQGKRGHKIAMDVLQGRSLAEESYEEVTTLFDALLKGLTDEKSR